MSSQQIPLDLGHRPALGRGDLLVTEGNKAAVAWIDNWPKWPSPVLALYGPAGCGKTHLVHVFAAQAHAELISPEDLAQNDALSLARQHKALAWDNADASADETALFHLLNAVREEDGHLLICGRLSPARWPVQLPDLKSRLNGLAAVEITPPDDATLTAVLAKLFRDRQLPVDADVLEYAVTRMPRSFDAAVTLVATADRDALARGQKITIPLLRDVLARTGISA